MLWSWNARRVTVLIRQCIRIKHYHRAWNTARRVMLQKPNKLDYTKVKLYRVISLLNFLGKI